MKNILLLIPQICIKMCYYHFNKNEVLGKAKERYSKEKTPEHYLQNGETIKQKQKNRYKNLPEKEKRQD